MKAIVLREKGSIDNLLPEDVPVPVPGPDEILVKIHAAGINPVDWKNALHGYFPMPLIAGSDIAGVVEAVGAGVKEYAPGDAIMGSLEWQKQGAFAEYVTTKAQYITKKPRNLSFTEAAAVPLAALTAWQALFVHAALQPGETIVIHAAAGGVGLFALQFAKLIGARVVATASERNQAFLYSMGADVVVDYTKNMLTDKIQQADAVLDSIVTPEAQLESFKALKKGGRYVAITATIREELVKDFDIRATRFLFHSDAAQLREIGQLIEQGKIKVLVAQTFPLEQAAAALHELHKGRTRGKIVLRIAD